MDELLREDSVDADVSSVARSAIRAVQKVFNKYPRLVTQMEHTIKATAINKPSAINNSTDSHPAPFKRKRQSTSNFMQGIQTKLPTGLVEVTGKSGRGHKRPGLTDLLAAGFIAPGKSNLVRAWP